MMAGRFNTAREQTAPRSVGESGNAANSQIAMRLPSGNAIVAGELPMRLLGVVLSGLRGGSRAVVSLRPSGYPPKKVAQDSTLII